jgi:hypothetical protein
LGLPPFYWIFSGLSEEKRIEKEIKGRDGQAFGPSTSMLSLSSLDGRVLALKYFRHGCC